MQTHEIPIEYHAAMFRALGNQTRLSRSGYTLTFTRDVIGRRDLSSDPGRARAQLLAAGLDPDGITPADVAAYRAWYEPLHESKRIGQARILITRPFGAERGDELVPVNVVALVDGWGNRIEEIPVDCESYRDPDAINQVGGRGAYRSRPDYARIEQVIAQLRADFPEFANTPVVDNNLVKQR